MGTQPFGSLALVRWCGGHPDVAEPARRDPGAESTTHGPLASKWACRLRGRRRAGGGVPSAGTPPPWLTQGGTGSDRRAEATRSVPLPCPSPPVTSAPCLTLTSQSKVVISTRRRNWVTITSAGGPAGEDLGRQRTGGWCHSGASSVLRSSEAHAAVVTPSRDRRRRRLRADALYRPVGPLRRNQGMDSARRREVRDLPLPTSGRGSWARAGGLDSDVNVCMMARGGDAAAASPRRASPSGNRSTQGECASR